MGKWGSPNILKPMLERPSKKESKTIMDYKKLVEPLELIICVAKVKEMHKW
jgi:hypothetical protein